jgi:ethanolamine utilization protein EutP
MKKIILMGRSECGKTTLTQALRGDVITYQKTQYINYYDVIIDTPGEYAENHILARALALYTYEADVVGLLLSSVEPYSLYPPCVTSACNRPVIGIVTQIDRRNGDPDRARRWLELAGCDPVFSVSSYTGEGIWAILEYLREADDVLPWDDRRSAERKRRVRSDKYGVLKAD